MAEHWQPRAAEFKPVIDVLATYIQREDDIDRLADYAYLDSRNIVRGGAPTGMWQERFKAAIRQGRVSPLLVAVGMEADDGWTDELSNSVRKVAERALFSIVGDRYQTLDGGLDALHGAEGGDERLRVARRLRDIARAVLRVIDQAGLWQALPIFSADSSLDEVHGSLARQCQRVIQAADYLIGLLLAAGPAHVDDVLPAETVEPRPVSLGSRDHLRAVVRAKATLAREARELALSLSFRIPFTKTE